MVRSRAADDFKAARSRRVLGWFGAFVAPASVSVTPSDFRDGRLASDSPARIWPP
jgi:hypothetical protein